MGVYRRYVGRGAGGWVAAAARADGHADAAFALARDERGDPGAGAGRGGRVGPVGDGAGEGRRGEAGVAILLPVALWPARAAQPAGVRGRRAAGHGGADLALVPVQAGADQR